MKRKLFMVRKSGLFLVSLVLGLALLVLAGGPSSADAQASDPLRVIESDTSHVVLELAISSYDARTVRLGNSTYTVLSVPGFGETNEAGKPQLPIRGAMIGIPPGAQTTLRVLVDQSRSSTLANPPPPAPTPQVQFDPQQPFPRSASNAYLANPGAYSANQLYPAASALIASTGDWRSQHFVTVEFHPLQYNAATRQLVFHTKLQVEVAFAYPRGPTTQALGGAVNEGPFESVLQNGLVNYASAKNWRTPGSATPRAPIKKSPVIGGTWFRLGVSADGMYRVTCGNLAAQNGSNLSVADPTTLQLFKQVFTTSVEYAINVVDNGGWGNCNSSDSADYVEFFGQAVNTKYTGTNVYWLTFGSATGKRMAARDGSGTGTVPATFPNTIHLEQNLLYRSTLPMVENTDHWYWTMFNPSTNSASYPFNLSAVAATGSASLQIDLYGYNVGNHETIVSVNGHQIADALWTGPGEYSATFPVPQADLASGSNTISVSEPSANSGQVAFLNYFNLTYQSTFAASNDTLRFLEANSGTWQYQISNFSTSVIEAFDITDPLNVARFVSTTITPASAPYTLRFGDTIAAPHSYIALTSAQLISPAVTKYAPPSPADLRSSSNSADYIAIGYGAFLPNLQPLINLRASQYPGRVIKLDVQSVYDQFNDGVFDPQAIRDFLSFAYQNWQTPKPSFVLLVGDGTYDPRRFCSTGLCPDVTSLPEDSTYIPAFLRLVDPFIGETDTDNHFVSFNDNAPSNPNTLPQMSIGRLPADSPADVTAMVNKIVNYEQIPASGQWRSKVAFVAGNAYDSFGNSDPAGNFWVQSEEVAGNPQFMPQGLFADRVYYNPCDPSSFPQCATSFPPYTTAASVENAIDSAINSGHLIVNYTGHSFIDYWGSYQGDQFFNESDISALSNGSLTPIMVEMTCYTGYFIFPGRPSLGEVDLRRANGGAVASWAATGLGVGEQGHDLLDKGFFNALMNQNTRQVGPATLAGKIYLFANSQGTNQDLIDTFLLLGDPATRLPIQLMNFLPFIKK